MAAKNLRVKTCVLVVLVAVFNSVGNVLLAKGMRHLGEVPGWSASTVAPYFLTAFSSGWIWLGISVLLLFFVSYLLVVSWADYSYVTPASAAGYALTPLLGHLLLGEVVTPARWAGVAFICVGVALVGPTPPSTTEQH